MAIIGKIPKKTDFKKPPAEIEAILRLCTLDQLTFLATFASKREFNYFIKIIKTIVDRKILLTFRHPESDPQKLALFKANARGQVEAYDNLTFLFNCAQDEITRRNKNVST